MDDHPKLTHWGCGQNLGLLGGSSCIHTITAFRRLGAVEDALATAQHRVVALEAAASAVRVTTTSGRLNKASTRGTGNLLRRRKF